MNKSELIRKTALIAGAPETEASLFFEIFIRSAADILNPGDIIQIKDLGFLHYKIAKANGESSIRDAKSIFPGSGWIDLIVYSESSEKINTKDPLYFIVPAKYEHDFAEIDAPFSLSFNKPVIHLFQKRDAYFIPQSYNELIRLLESKAARLLVNAKVIKNENKENEVFVPGAAAVDEQQMSFQQTDTAVLPGEKTDISEREKLLTPEAEKEFNELTEALEQTFKEDKKGEIIPSAETIEEKFNEVKEELADTFTEDKKEEVVPPETKHIDEQLSDLHEHKAEDISGEEKDQIPVSETGGPETLPSPEEETKKEVKAEPPAEEKDIDKLLSKASFGANIPWKFDEISIIEPGRREEPVEESTEESLGEDETGAQETQEESVEAQENEPETITGAGSVEGKIEEPETKDSAAPEDIVQKSETAQEEITSPKIFDESLSLSKDEYPLSDKIETPEEEQPFHDFEPKIEPGLETMDSGELQEIEPPLIQPEEENIEPEPPVHEEEFGQDEKIKDFTDAEFNEGIGQAETFTNIDETINEPKSEYGTETPESSAEPSEDKDYEVIKPVKLKYDWKEGFLKDAEEPPVPEEFKEEEKKDEAETADEEGYIEIKPGVSKEKIDFLADSEEEEQEVKTEEPVPEEDRAQKDLKEYISKIEEIDKETSNKRKSITILTLIIFLLFVGVGVFLYYEYIFKKNKGAGKTVTVVVKNPKTIERDFAIPVTYPYSKNENKDNLYTQPIDSSIIAVSLAGLTGAPKVEAPKTESGTTQPSTTVPSTKLENLGDYIYRLGNDYIVQIASFNTETRANAQVASLKKANYDAYVDMVSRSDGSVYYRVMIRGFKSYEQAKSFLK